jgi:hypothetical protein
MAWKEQAGCRLGTGIPVVPVLRKLSAFFKGISRRNGASLMILSIAAPKMAARQTFSPEGWQPHWVAAAGSGMVPETNNECRPCIAY